MDTTVLYEDEIIADSEEEEHTLKLQSVESIQVNTAMRCNTRQATDFVATSNTLAAQSSGCAKAMSPDETTTRPRPRPRPIYKKAVTDAADSTCSGVDHSANSSIPTWSNQDHMDFPSGTSNIADRAKMRSRKTRPKVIDIIELTSDEDEMALLTAPKTRPKPRRKNDAKPKSSQLSTGTAIPGLQTGLQDVKNSTNQFSNIPHSDPHYGHATQDTLPVPTSSIRSNDLLLSKLPPSDPPTSTAIIHDQTLRVTSPIHVTEKDIPPSSPSSLFSIPSSSRKRKRKCTNEFDSDEGTDPDTTMLLGSKTIDPHASPALLSPPHFAGSSSSPSDIFRPISPAVVVDPTTVTADSELPLKVLETRKPRKNGGTTKNRLDSAGSHRKQKAKIPKKKLEVVISERTKKKGKEKEKEVFKSREFINDSSDDLVGQTPVKGVTTLSKPASLTSLSSVPDSEDDMQGGRKGEENVAHEYTQPTTREDDTSYNRTSVPAKATRKGKGKRVIVSDDEVEDETAGVQLHKKGLRSASVTDKSRGRARNDVPEVDNHSGGPSKDHVTDENDARTPKENIQPIPSPALPPAPMPSLFPSLTSRYSIAPRTKSAPMSELIRRVNSLPGSPFSTPRPRASNSSHPKVSASGTAYSPYLKSSKSLLSRIAPLHPNRRTPPPPLPPPPPPKKTKKELEREEQWEEELIESVGGITEWACMSDVERKEMRKAKREQEMLGWED